MQALQIAGLTYGPHGVGRLEGKVIFVRGVLPGEEVDVRVREERRSYAFADVEQVRRAAAERRDPPCRYLPRCGGCPWQHMQYAAQLRAKEQNVRDQLRRIGGLADVPVRPILPSPLEFGYRNRLSLRVEDKCLGFYAAGSHDLVPVQHCLLGEESVDAAVPPAADLVRRLASQVRRVEISARGDGTRVVLRGEVHGTLADADEALIPAWLEQAPQVAGIVLHGRGWRRVWGDEWIRFPVPGGVDVHVRGGVFTQVNPEGNRHLVDTVLQFGAFRPADRVLDLYAGAGNFSVALAPLVGAVVAVEQDPLAAEDAVAGMVRLRTGNVRVLRAAAAAGLRQLLEEGDRFDTILLDPPRSGAAECITPLLQMAAPRLVYVSCNPATLGRDLKGLARRYRVTAVQPIDLFPQSYHVECVVSAVLTC